MDIKRLLNIILYVLNKIDEASKTKLLKLMFFADFEHAERYNKPILWTKYFRLENGPAPSYLLDIINTSIGKSNYAKEKDVQRFEEVIKIEFKKVFDTNATFLKPLREPDLDDISESEKEVLDYVIGRYGHFNAKQLSKATHNHEAWKKKTDDKRLKYSDVITDNKKKKYFQIWEEDFEAIYDNC